MCPGCPAALELPESLSGLVDPKLAVRPAAYLTKASGSLMAAPGASRTWGAHDVPVGAAWEASAKLWDRSPYEGESFYLQLNMEDIPAVVRRPEWPAVGVLWVTLDIADSWMVRTYFDPRPAASIQWASCAPVQAPAWTLSHMWAPAHDAAYPALSGNECLQEELEEWILNKGLHRPSASPRVPSDSLQIGGWAWACQGETVDTNEGFVAMLPDQCFGDCGELRLHYSPEKGFFGFADTH